MSLGSCLFIIPNPTVLLVFPLPLSRGMAHLWSSPFLKSLNVNLNLGFPISELTPQLYLDCSGAKSKRIMLKHHTSTDTFKKQLHIPSFLTCSHILNAVLQEMCWTRGLVKWLCTDEGWESWRGSFANTILSLYPRNLLTGWSATIRCLIFANSGRLWSNHFLFEWTEKGERSTVLDTLLHTLLCVWRQGEGSTNWQNTFYPYYSHNPSFT